MGQFFGGTLEFGDDRFIDKEIDLINKKMALYLIEQGIRYVNKLGILELEESYILYKCLLKLKENEIKDNNIPDSNMRGDTN